MVVEDFLGEIRRIRRHGLGMAIIRLITGSKVRVSCRTGVRWIDQWELSLVDARGETTTHFYVDIESVEEVK